jgi:hypothetical protein
MSGELEYVFALLDKDSPRCCGSVTTTGYIL